MLYPAVAGPESLCGGEWLGSKAYAGPRTRLFSVTLGVLRVYCVTTKGNVLLAITVVMLPCVREILVDTRSANLRSFKRRG
jgi:hypothetical protein